MGKYLFIKIKKICYRRIRKRNEKIDKRKKNRQRIRKCGKKQEKSIRKKGSGKGKGERTGKEKKI